MTATAPAPTATTCPPADLERRFYAFVIDRAVTWGLYAGGGYLAWRLLVEPGRTLAGVLAVLALVLAVMGVSAALLALAGLSPGKAALGLRVVPSGAGAALGPGAAALRTLVVGLAGPSTLGLGAATLAWTAVSDPGGRRRGWHDHLSGTVVVDVRPAPVVHEPPAPAPAPLVNLTTMRLMPVAPHPVAAPGPPVVQAPAVPPEDPGRWRVSFDTGESFVVEGLAVVGRHPEPRPGEPVRHTVALGSADLSLSKTHAQLRVVPDGALVVMDRGSTNGTVVVRQGHAKPLTAGRAATLLDGDQVRLGDRTMSVRRTA